jgi:hypothetical protein
MAGRRPPHESAGDLTAGGPGHYHASSMEQDTGNGNVPFSTDDAEPLLLVRRKAPPEDRWASPASEPPPPAVEGLLESITEAPDRDAIVDRACEAALTVSERAVFLALRKDTLRGFRGKGPGASSQGLENLSLSTTHTSVFQQVVSTGEAHDGPHGNSPADSVFRAAIGAKSQRLVVHPVRVGERLAGLLCADAVTHGAAGAAHIGVIAGAMGDALHRLLVRSRH